MLCQDLESINTLRALALDSIQKANSGHPGMPLGAAPMAFWLWQHQLRFCPAEPLWPDRDRFVLSAGHASALLYGLLHLYGYPLGLEDLKAFRQWGSKTPGHPEVGLTPGVEATTGPLGQGHANAVGMAIAERALAFRFNRPGFEVVNHHTYALLSDGDIMEGVAFEAAAVAGHLKLGKLICLYDSNDVTLEGPTSWCFTEDVAARYEAMGWHVQTVEDGNSDLAAIGNALMKAREERRRPSLVVVKTTLGFGSPNNAGKAAAHGSPLGTEEVEKTKAALGCPREAFFVPKEVYTHCAQATRRGEAAFASWKALFAGYAAKHPELAEEFERRLRGELPEASWGEGLEELLPKNSLETRSAASLVLQSLGKQLPELLGGDADLSSSTKSALAGEKDFEGQAGEGRNIRFGVREHGMAAAANGIALHGQCRPYVSTFFSFCDYMRPAMRMAALSHLPVVYVFTHDSIGVGEDGPTHQPVEQLASLRAIPNLDVVRPCDGPEAAQAWLWALERKEGPTALVLTRQKLPYLDRSRLAPAKMLSYGAYVLKEEASAPLEGVFLASGSEVHLALAAQSLLMAQGVAVRVLSMPCMEIFRRMPKGYRDEVLPPGIGARVAIEAGISQGWHEWVGAQGVVLGMEGFGASAPAEVLFRKFGFTAEAAAAAMLKQLGRPLPL